MPNTLNIECEVVNRLGLHSRPAVLFVQTAQKYKSDISAECIENGKSSDGKSILSMLFLEAVQGCHLRISATGSDAAEALKELKTLVDGGFDE